ncbi:MAG: 2-oxoglutarate ferredoxin oxidoreductase subunit beta [Proteobacteria bacterium]|nr:2-oxoglutarate ferredoxin oxidoreductase subunit beta [Pseudomonadota bacterium]MBU4277474.1 2-oxoglutarate ferredoxin oxidoreductase subunit beta [Pseudomonadota bacterium]MBU4384857.1 2-oxoglutarate ferredoxin oxidoreductase subunit beta [Pseudomonadota bacterium]MBU4604562.1 2-oxoglutarate ferredoxin oxidoreductase subunit beta [Pseudomonadota bacterium]MCG2764701.1 thiamine pyrophosphate-dependent enzyme [Desulfarculaceae bacterium]
MQYSSATLIDKYLRTRKIPSTACSGCGLGINHKVVVQAIDELGLEPNDIIWGTSIGCAGRQTFATWKGDGFAGTHGRVYAIARGLRIALPPEKKIICTVGDGDAFGIGLMHLIHSARSNADMTIIVNDNLGYQSTGGQFGFTTPQGAHTDSSPYGMFEHNLMSEGMDVMHILKGAGATFLARHVAMDGQRAVESVKRAILNPGFSLVHMPYPCPTNFASRELGSRNQVNIYRWIKERAKPLEEADENTVWATGVWHDATGSRPEFSEHVWASVNKIRKTGAL